ncbi:MAG: RsmB/NOP family class I SAM-dependent RNA methyltransferase [Verrucomicrobiia bacterium]
MKVEGEPGRLAIKLAKRLFADEREQTHFLAALAAGNAARPAALWMDAPPDSSPFPPLQDPPIWVPEFVTAFEPGARPGQLPEHGAGALYSFDLSSVFSVAAICELDPRPADVLDVCAAPGGKALFLWRALKPRRLIANEAIVSRLGILKENLRRCRAEKVEVMRCDPRHLANILATTQDLVLVDAPCSGQSLLARGIQNDGCFHPVTIRRNAMRQRRVLAEASKTVRPGGSLFYSTCTFSIEENEAVVEWFLKSAAGWEPLDLTCLAPHRSIHSTIPTYRLFPQAGFGAGAFVAALRAPQAGWRK